MQNDARQQRRTMSHFQRKDPADRFSAQQVHQKVHRKPVSVPKGFFATILTYLQQLQTQQSKAGRQNWHEWSSTFLHGKTQKRRPGQDKKKVFFSFGSWCRSQIKFVWGFFLPFCIILFIQVAFKAEERAYLEALPTACIQSWHAEQWADAIKGHHRITDPAPSCCRGFCFVFSLPWQNNLYPQCLCCRKVSPIIQEIPKDNSYLFFPRLPHPLLTQRKEKKKLTRTEFCFPTHDFFLIRFAAATDTVMTASIHIQDLKGSLKK